MLVTYGTSEMETLDLIGHYYHRGNERIVILSTVVVVSSHISDMHRDFVAKHTARIQIHLVNKLFE
jgi:hypothetical protein